MYSVLTLPTYLHTSGHHYSVSGSNKEKKHRGLFSPEEAVSKYKYKELPHKSLYMIRALIHNA